MNENAKFYRACAVHEELGDETIFYWISLTSPHSSDFNFLDHVCLKSAGNSMLAYCQYPQKLRSALSEK